jgi:hypothetical protein
MGILPMLPKTFRNPQRKGSCFTWEELPHSYMSDYSVLGILVNRVQEIIGLLEENDFTLIKNHTPVQVVFDDLPHMRELFRVLEKHGIQFEISDVLDQIYQG